MHLLTVKCVCAPARARNNGLQCGCLFHVKKQKDRERPACIMRLAIDKKKCNPEIHAVGTQSTHLSPIRNKH